MITTTDSSNTASTEVSIKSLIPYVRQTRQYGHTYVHAAVRDSVAGWQGLTGTLDGRDVRVTFSGYGRSLQAGGHKYKAHARFTDTGKPVASKDLTRIEA